MVAFPEKTRLRAIALRRKGHTYNEIAKTLRISIPTVGMWVRDAIKAKPRKNRDLIYAQRLRG